MEHSIYFALLLWFIYKIVRLGMSCTKDSLYYRLYLTALLLFLGLVPVYIFVSATTKTPEKVKVIERAYFEDFVKIADRIQAYEETVTELSK